MTQTFEFPFVQITHRDSDLNLNVLEEEKSLTFNLSIILN